MIRMICRFLLLIIFFEDGFIRMHKTDQPGIIFRRLSFIL